MPIASKPVFQPLPARSIPDYAGLFCKAFNRPPWDEGWELEEAREHLHRMFGRTGKKAFTVSEKGEVRGLLIGDLTPTTGAGKKTFLIHEIFIDPDHHHRRLATFLLTELSKRLHWENCHFVRVDTHRDIVPFYAANGFEMLQVIGDNAHMELQIKSESLSRKKVFNEIVSGLALSSLGLFLMIGPLIGMFFVTLTWDLQDWISAFIMPPIGCYCFYLGFRRIRYYAKRQPPEELPEAGNNWDEVNP